MEVVLSFFFGFSMVKMHFLQKVLKKWSSFRKKNIFFFHNRGEGGPDPFMEFSIIFLKFFLTLPLKGNTFNKFVFENFMHKRANDFCKINIILTTITNHVTLITENETWSMLMDRLLRRRGDKDCQTFPDFPSRK